MWEDNSEKGTWDPNSGDQCIVCVATEENGLAAPI